MRCGKTTVGRLLAAELKMAFRDLDHDVEVAAAAPVGEIWRRFGEEGFRQLESDALRAVVGAGAVVATGGGIVESDSNVATLRETGLCLWLDASFAVLWGRGMEDVAEDRPLWREERQLQALYQRRRPLYSFAAVVLDADRKTPIELARQAATFVRQREVDA